MIHGDLDEGSQTAIVLYNSVLRAEFCTHDMMGQSRNTVQMFLDDNTLGGVSSVQCTCYSDVQWCEHSVALYFVCLEKPEWIVRYDSFKQKLQKLDRNSLENVILNMIFKKQTTKYDVEHLLPTNNLSVPEIASTLEPSDEPSRTELELKRTEPKKSSCREAFVVAFGAYLNEKKVKSRPSSSLSPSDTFSSDLVWERDPPLVLKNSLKTYTDAVLSMWEKKLFDHALSLLEEVTLSFLKASDAHFAYDDAPFQSERDVPIHCLVEELEIVWLDLLLDFPETHATRRLAWGMRLENTDVGSEFKAAVEGSKRGWEDGDLVRVLHNQPPHSRVREPVRLTAYRLERLVDHGLHEEAKALALYICTDAEKETSRKKSLRILRLAVLVEEFVPLVNLYFLVHLALMSYREEPLAVTLLVYLIERFLNASLNVRGVSVSSSSTANVPFEPRKSTELTVVNGSNNLTTYSFEPNRSGGVNWTPALLDLTYRKTSSLIFSDTTEIKEVLATLPDRSHIEVLCLLLQQSVTKAVQMTPNVEKTLSMMFYCCGLYYEAFQLFSKSENYLTNMMMSLSFIKIGIPEPDRKVTQIRKRLLKFSSIPKHFMNVPGLEEAMNKVSEKELDLFFVELSLIVGKPNETAEKLSRKNGCCPKRFLKLAEIFYVNNARTAASIMAIGSFQMRRTEEANTQSWKDTLTWLMKYLEKEKDQSEEDKLFKSIFDKLNRAPDGFEIASFLLKEGHEKAAIRVAEHSVAIPSKGLSKFLEDFLSKLPERHQDFTFRLRTVAFKKKPSFNRLRSLAVAAGPNRWPDILPAILSDLRHMRGNEENRIEIFARFGYVQDVERVLTPKEDEGPSRTFLLLDKLCRLVHCPIPDTTENSGRFVRISYLAHLVDLVKRSLVKSEILDRVFHVFEMTINDQQVAMTLSHKNKSGKFESILLGFGTNYIIDHFGLFHELKPVRPDLAACLASKWVLFRCRHQSNSMIGDYHSLVESIIEVQNLYLEAGLIGDFEPFLCSVISEPLVKRKPNLMNLIRSKVPPISKDLLEISAKNEVNLRKSLESENEQSNIDPLYLYLDKKQPSKKKKSTSFFQNLPRNSEDAVLGRVLIEKSISR